MIAPERAAYLKNPRQFMNANFIRNSYFHNSAMPTFHYGEIKTDWNQSPTQRIATLHSTMERLKRVDEGDDQTVSIALHSTMERLKPAAAGWERGTADVFTFHYGEIKTLGGGNIPAIYTSLHSTMERLKLTVICWCLRSEGTLHSTMERLKPIEFKK